MVWNFRTLLLAYVKIFPLLLSWGGDDVGMKTPTTPSENVTLREHSEYITLEDLVVPKIRRRRNSTTSPSSSNIPFTIKNRWSLEKRNNVPNPHPPPFRWVAGDHPPSIATMSNHHHHHHKNMRRKTKFLGEGENLSTNPTGHHKYPFFVHVPGAPSCGGSLIWPDIVLTAAHCQSVWTLGSAAFVGSIATSHGHHDTYDRAEKNTIQWSYVHPKYIRKTNEHDIMLVVLARLSSAPVVALNPNPNQHPNRDDMIVVGLDLTSKKDFASPPEAPTTSRMESNEQIADPCRYCSQQGAMAQGKRSNMVGKSTNARSSGAVSNSQTNFLYGLYSFDFGCATLLSRYLSRRRVYTVATDHITFVENFICMYSAKPPDGRCSPMQRSLQQFDDIDTTTSETSSPQPSSAPSSFYPSYMPPSTIPSIIPSQLQSSFESSFDTSDIFSESPSPFPDVVLSSPPSNVPSEIPSMVPTSRPSPLPSSIPSMMFSGNPSTTPSLLPSSIPSGIPTQFPSGIPSVIPSGIPSTNVFVPNVTRVDYDVQVSYLGVDYLDDDEIEIWLEISRSWLEENYNDIVMARIKEMARDRLHLQVALEFLKQEVTINLDLMTTNTITYNEFISYSSRETADEFSPDLLRNMTMNDETALAELVELLQIGIPSMAELEGVQLVVIQSSNVETTSSGLSPGVIISIITVVSLIAVLTALWKGYLWYRSETRLAEI